MQRRHAQTSMSAPRAMADVVQTLLLKLCGWFDCQCNFGYEPAGDGVSCTDINECADPLFDKNGTNAKVNREPNLHGGQTFFKQPGYAGNGFSCTECTVA